MAEYTQNLNLEKPAENENFRRQVWNDNMDKIDTAVKGLRDRLDNGVKVMQPLTWGMNHIRNDGETPVFPGIKVKGRHYVNLLGKDGNCEDVSKWATFQSTTALDGTNKVFGSNSIKVTITSVSGDIFRNDVFNLVNSNKYYMAQRTQRTVTLQQVSG